MNIYNKIMLFFWLAAGIISMLIVSFNCFTIGFDKWGSYYITPVIAFMMYFFKRWMMKRMEKHNEYLGSINDKHNESKHAKSNTSN
jgi:hypothetical protein